MKMKMIWLFTRMKNFIVIYYIDYWTKNHYWKNSFLYIRREIVEKDQEKEVNLN